MAQTNFHSQQFEFAVKDRAAHLDDLYSFDYQGVKYCVTVNESLFVWSGFVLLPANHPDCNKTLSELNIIYPGVYNKITLRESRAIGFTTNSEHDYNLAVECINGSSEGMRIYKSFDFVKGHARRLATMVKERLDMYHEQQSFRNLDFSVLYPNIINRRQNMSDLLDSFVKASVRYPNPASSGNDRVESQLNGIIDELLRYVSRDQDSRGGYPVDQTPRQFNCGCRECAPTTKAAEPKMTAMEYLYGRSPANATRSTNTQTTTTPAPSTGIPEFDSIIKTFEDMGFTVVPTVIPMDVFNGAANTMNTPVSPIVRDDSSVNNHASTIPEPNLYDDMPELVDNYSDSTDSDDYSDDDYSNDYVEDDKYNVTNNNANKLPVVEDTADTGNASFYSNPTYFSNNSYVANFPDLYGNSKAETTTPTSPEYSYMPNPLYEGLKNDLDKLDYDDIHALEKLFPGMLQKLINGQCPDCNTN